MARGGSPNWYIVVVVDDDNDEVEDDKEHGTAVEVEVEVEVEVTGNFSVDADTAKEEGAAKEEDAANDDINRFSSASPPLHELARGLFVDRRKPSSASASLLFRPLIAASWAWKKRRSILLHLLLFIKKQIIH